MIKKSQHPEKVAGIAGQPTALPSSAACAMPPQVSRMYELYGDAEAFMNRFHPGLETYAARSWDRAYLGEAPTLACVAEGYGISVAEVWLCIEIEGINTFSTARAKLNVDQQRELAQMILAEYGFLKVSEVLLFAHRFKCGRYRQFYGAIDAQVILMSLIDFIAERRTERAYLFDLQRKQQIEALRQTDPEAVSHDDYLRLTREHQHNSTNTNLKKPSL